ncbi:MAG: nucleoside deaminase [Rhodospirillales bacterium]|nr:nucleoside deaminase [Rhodospirillales bacterium]
MASIWAGVGRIVFGVGREDVHEMYFEDRHLGTMDYIRDAYRNDLTIDGGACAVSAPRWIMGRMMICRPKSRPVADRTYSPARIFG